MIRRSTILAVAAFVFVTVFGTVKAEAACFTPKRRVVEHWAWVSKSDPNDVFCASNPYIISPPIEYYYDWTLVGEEIYECDGSYNEWGDVSCDEGLVTYREAVCEPICNE
ncbi:MAG TPA: hypothetical protein VF215_10380 [Thermoanaerobaculia bacterium]